VQVEEVEAVPAVAHKRLEEPPFVAVSGAARKRVGRPAQHDPGVRIDAGAEPPDRAAMAALYVRMADLPPQLQMFMAGCAPELEDLRDRINRREIVMRNLLALSAGVTRTVCWNLAPEIPNYEDRLSVMDLFYGKFALMAYEGTDLTSRRPSAEAFALLTDQIRGVEEVTRLEVPGGPGLRVFDVRRPGRGPLLVVWDQRDPIGGEAEPAVAFDWPWPAPAASAIDALGCDVRVELGEGRVRLPVSLTPVFVRG
jgi:hypothetical protein